MQANKLLILLVAVLATCFTTYSQLPDGTNIIGQEFNPIRTTVPFLTIAPDSRAAGMGDIGAATEPDVASQHWNPAKYAFIKDKTGANISVTPWLRNLGITDIYLSYLSGYYKVDKTQAISGSLRYFTLGQMIFTNDRNEEQGRHNPNEFALDVAYSRLFSENFSGAVTFRYIRSDLGRTALSSGAETYPGNSFAADISSYYRREIDLSDKNAILAFGLNISNIGTKISYTDNNSKEFIPTNLRFGSSLKTFIDEYNTFAVSLDINKLLVPTTPIYDSVGGIASGMDPNVPVLTGMIHSFYDAPIGDKETRELIYNLGFEYGYSNQFFVRAGYFHENQWKGNRKYYTMGVGLKYNVLDFDLAYMIPVGGRTSPLANTVRISLGFNFGSPTKR